jgi:hypothetical protein
MKKYFSLFATSLMILEACFIAGSSLSHAMKSEFDESQNIVISNSRGQKILHQEDPAADLRLNPGKGETLWFEEKQIWCHHPYLDGKVYSFQYPEFIEITLSYPALNSELLGLAYGLHAYNVGKTGEKSDKDLIASYNPIDGNSTISFNGELQQQGLYLVWKEEDIKRSPNAAVILLREIQKQAQQTGIHSIYIFSPVLFCPYRNVPSEEGFHLTGYDAGDNTQVYYKTASEFLNDSQEDNHHVTLQYVEEEGFSLPNFGSCFGIFIRNDKGLVQGGVFGNLHKQASLPYGSIEVFLVDEAIRSAGFGKKAFSMTENFLKESGVQMIELGTADHQAPWFYKKMEYAPVIIFPETTKTLDGKWSNHYKFEKRL